MIVIVIIRYAPLNPMSVGSNSKQYGIIKQVDTVNNVQLAKERGRNRTTESERAPMSNPSAIHKPSEIKPSSMDKDNPGQQQGLVSTMDQSKQGESTRVTGISN